MSLEKQKENNQSTNQSTREIESHHFNREDPLGADDDFVMVNEISLEKAKKLIFFKQAKLAIDFDSQGLSRALVKDEKGKIIFSTAFPFEIEELADIAYNTDH